MAWVTYMCLKIHIALFKLNKGNCGTRKQIRSLGSLKAIDLWDCSDLPLEVSRALGSHRRGAPSGEEGIERSTPGVRPTGCGPLSTLCTNGILRTSVSLLQDGRPDVSFFAPDCLHPNQKFHSQLSRALWVNMVK